MDPLGRDDTAQGESGQARSRPREQGSSDRSERCKSKQQDRDDADDDCVRQLPVGVGTSGLAI
jgi:hypothetical protein